MLNIYTGKLSYSHYAKDTIITFVVPDGKDENDSCLVYWQWGVDAAGTSNVNKKFTGKFGGTLEYTVEVRAYDEVDYWFIWVVSTNEVQMMDQTNELCGPPFSLSLVFPNT